MKIYKNHFQTNMGNIFNVARASPESIAMATKFVNEAIAKNKVVIFSKTYCPYCTMAKEVIFFVPKDSFIDNFIRLAPNYWFDLFFTFIAIQKIAA